MPRTPLILSVAALMVACGPLVSPNAPSPSTLAERASLLPSPTVTAGPTSTPTPTANVSPAPNAARLILSDATLVADGRPHFLFQAAGEDRLRAVAWTGTTNGVLAGTAPPKATLRQSPDGARYVLNGKIYGFAGDLVGVLPWLDGSVPTWSRDGQFLCRALPVTPQTGSAMQLQTVVPGQQPRVVATGYGIYSDNAGYPVLACDAQTDRVIVASLGQGLFAGHLWVFRLSTGALLRSEDIGANVAGSWIAASADGTLLAHSVHATNADPPTTTIRTAESPTALQTLPNFEGHGFSGDGSLLLGVTGGSNSIAIIDWKAARRTWGSTGLAYGGFFPEPNGNHFAVGLGFVGGAEDKGDVYLVGPDGTSIEFPSGGYHAVFRY
ncbi:MAG TPA: hypothetical protein VIN70_07230 [Candidatus Limnocylindria bacterium]